MEDSQGKNDVLLGILSYLGILVVIPLVVKPKTDFVKFHAKQGLVLFIAEIIVSLLGYTLFWPLAVIASLINVIILVFIIIGIVNVVQNREQELPLIGHLARSFNF